MKTFAITYFKTTDSSCTSCMIINAESQEYAEKIAKENGCIIGFSISEISQIEKGIVFKETNY